MIVDSVYSTTGALCPLQDMVEVVERHGAMLLVDESHSLGTHGPTGAGLCAAFGLTHRVHFITASLAKAFAGRADFFTMPTALHYYILSESFPNIFGSCLLPHEIAGLAATLQVIQGLDNARAPARPHRPTARKPDGHGLPDPSGDRADHRAGGAGHVRRRVLRASHQPQPLAGAPHAQR